MPIIMKKDTATIRENSVEHLYKDLPTAYKALRELRFKISQGEIKDPSVKNKTKKQIARLWTIIREKEVANLLQNVDNAN